MVFPACQMPMRSGDSCFVYQDEVTKETVGTNGPSVTPTTNRQRMNPQPPCNGGHADCRDGPGKHAAGHKKARTALGHDDVGGDLRDDVSDVEHGDAGRPHCVRHV